VPRRHLRLRDADGGELRAGFAKIRAELKLPESFPPAVETEAHNAAEALKLRPDDVLDLPFLTIDPPGSMDLDQAMHLERHNGGYRVRYAIADVASFVSPGGAIDTEARLRGETLYSPDTRTPLHPPSLSEGAASLLP
jgi:exoribonuclease R